MTRALIWDFDGTLGYRDGGQWTGTLLELLREARPDLEVTDHQLKSFLRSGYPWHVPERPHPELADPGAWWASLQPVLAGALLGVGVPAAQAGEVAARFRARYLEPARWRLYADTLSGLAALREGGWTHLLLTNHVPELPAIIDHLGLTPLLAGVFNSAQTGYEKPHPQAFRTVLDAAGPCEAFWMIGDNINADVRGAEALGLPAILLRGEHPEARWCCAGLAEVAAVISSPPAGVPPTREPSNASAR